eukprot:6880576-Pyramimonas_sp.AAC.1
MAAFLASKASMAGLAATPVTKSRANASRAVPAAPARRGALQVTAKKTADGPVVAIAGVTGAVGQEFLQVGLCDCWVVTIGTIGGFFPL